ncbi:MAG: hypothetical protein V4471_06125 [Pseudomonadota bacterium]
MPLSDTVIWNKKSEEVSITFSRLPKVDSEDRLCASLNQIANLAIWKLHANKLIKQIQILLKDSRKDDCKKFVEICQVIDEVLNTNRLNDPLATDFCVLFKKEILDFIWQEIESTIKKSSTELQARLEELAKKFSGENLKPSPLRDLLNELKEVTERCARKNRWPVPTGVRKLLNLLGSLDWKKDEELPQLLSSCSQVIAERLKYSYLMRDELTYFLYRNFYFILTKVSGESFEIICEKINFFNELSLQKCTETNNVFTSLYLYLLEIKGKLNSEQWNNKGKTLGIFANKLPDGIYRLRMSFNKLPENLSMKDEDQIQLIKIFMQINEILFEKVASSATRDFRAVEVGEFYKDLYKQIQAIYNALSQQDREVFCVVYGEANDKKARDILAIPKGYALLSNPENLLKLYSQQWSFWQGAARMSNRNVCGIPEDCEPSGNTAENSSAKSIFELTSERGTPRPGCSRWS